TSPARRWRSPGGARRRRSAPSNHAATTTTDMKQWSACTVVHPFEPARRSTAAAVDPEIRARRRGQRATHVRENAGRAQAADGINGPQRHVYGVESDVWRARPVRHAGPATGHWLAPSTGAPPAPGARGGKREPDWATDHHLIGR